jgi:hypothetical protein
MKILGKTLSLKSGFIQMQLQAAINDQPQTEQRQTHDNDDIKT